MPGFNPPYAFNSAFTDFYNVSQMYKMGGMSHERYMAAAKQAYDTMKAVTQLTFWSVMTELRGNVPDDVYMKWMRVISEEENQFDDLTPEERFHKMVELIENTQVQIDPSVGEE